MSVNDQTPNDAEYARLKAQSETSPGDPEILHRLGAAAAARGHQADAVRAFAKAAQLKSDWAAPCFGLAAALHALGQEDAAITAYRSALVLEPNHSEAHFQLARLLEKKGHASDAAAHYNAASLHSPDWPEPHLYRGALHEARGEFEDARRAYNRAISLGAPAGFALRRDLQVPIIPVSKASYAEARASYLRALDAHLADPPSIGDPVREAGGNRFFLAYHGLDDRPFQEKQARLMRTACPSLSWTAPHCRAAAPLGAPRRIGIASRFLHDHSIGRLMVGLLAHLHARKDCRIYLFHAVTPQDDDLRREIEALADSSTILPGDLQGAREAIAGARLDVLFYPDIGMDPVTYFLAQARLAPVQCATWGHPITTGMPTIDYFLSCDAAEPDGAEAHYSEILVRLGGLPFSYRRPSSPDPLGSRADFDLPEEATIYFLAQNLFKIHPDMDAALAEILRGDPTGLVLLLEGQDRNWGQILRDRFAETIGPDAERIVFRPRQSHENYMRLLALSDVSLDSFPFCGGNTTYQSLAMGTPVVTLPGDYLRGRLSLAIYRHMEMMDCVAADSGDFARIALRLGTDTEFRQTIEKQIEIGNEKIFDDPIFLRDAQDFLLTVEPRPT
jgi:protein O-GlcNAc transferase